MRRKAPVPFGKGPTEKDPNHGHLAGGLLHPAGRNGANSRNGTRPKTLVTEAGPVEIEVPRDRESSCEPVIVAKRQCRLSGIDDLVVSLSAKGLTHGEFSAHLAEIYGAEVPGQTISAITDRVVEGMAAWQSRPLDPVYPVFSGGLPTVVEADSSYLCSSAADR